MADLTIRIKANFDAARAKQFFSSAPERLDDAMHLGTVEATMLLADRAEGAIEDIAGDVYWDIQPGVRRTPRGGHGTVMTPPSRPHPIEPNGPYPLRFQINGEWVSTYHVDHPGSNPVNWPDNLGGFTSQAERLYEYHVGRTLDPTRFGG